MAQGEITGATPQEVAEQQWEHYHSPLYENHGVPYEVAFCGTEIGKQPEDYDGPTRYCKRRASKRSDWDGDDYAIEAYNPSCPFHGGSNDQHGHTENLQDPAQARITHGMYARDENLRANFDDSDHRLYESIMEWAEVYGWPDESEDPARYHLLRTVALESVRGARSFEYLDEEGEVQMRDVYDDQGVVIGQQPEENALSREHRLLQSFIMDVMKELGLTPKQNAGIAADKASVSRDEAIADIAGDALHAEKSFDPDEFTESRDDGPEEVADDG